jgi:hypothetical protein
LLNRHGHASAFLGLGGYKNQAMFEPVSFTFQTTSHVIDRSGTIATDSRT